MCDVIGFAEVPERVEHNALVEGNGVVLKNHVLESVEDRVVGLVVVANELNKSVDDVLRDVRVIRNVGVQAD